MGAFTPLQEQAPVALPSEDPLLNLQLGEAFDVQGIPKIRHEVVGFLGAAVVSEHVGAPVPDAVIEIAEFCLAELVSNAERPNRLHPEASRHATGIYVWAYDGLLDIGVGDNSDRIDANDNREQTAILPPSQKEDCPVEDLDAILEGLEETGLGGIVVARLADAVCHSLVSIEDAASSEEPRTHKVIRFILRVVPDSPLPIDLAA